MYVEAVKLRKSGQCLLRRKSSTVSKQTHDDREDLGALQSSRSHETYQHQDTTSSI
jgi:hypothetical protein